LSVSEFLGDLAARGFSPDGGGERLAADGDAARISSSSDRFFWDGVCGSFFVGVLIFSGLSADGRFEGDVCGVHITQILSRGSKV